MDQEKNQFLKFIKVLLAVFLCGAIGVAAFVVLVDPFYHYHKPWLGIPAILENAVYQTPGAAANLEYTDVILGSSMTENFHTSWFDDELGWNAIKLSYSGGRTDDLKAILGQIFGGKREVNHVFMDLNEYQLSSESWTTYVKRPEYLYDGKWWTDYSYLWNKNVIAMSVGRSMDALSGRESNLDSAYTWEDEALFNKEAAREDAQKIWKTLHLDEHLMESRETIGDQAEAMDEAECEVCRENIGNITPFIEQNPQTEFIIYLPPYSMLYWEYTALDHRLTKTIDLYQYALSLLLEYDNVRVFCFQSEKDMITNLDNYRDSTHYRPEYNRYIFECMESGADEITRDNIDAYFEDLRALTRDYPYESLWD